MRQYPRLTSLTYLSLRTNVLLDGTLADLAPMKQLQTLNVDSAQLRATPMFDFSGFNQLTSLVLSGTSLYGALAPLDLPALTVLEVRQTALSGPLPPLRLPRLRNIDLSLTKITGSVHSFDHCTDLVGTHARTRSQTHALAHWFDFLSLTLALSAFVRPVPDGDVLGNEWRHQR